VGIGRTSTLFVERLIARRTISKRYGYETQPKNLFQNRQLFGSKRDAGRKIPRKLGFFDKCGMLANMHWVDRLPGGYADKGPPSGVSQDQIQKGVRVEMEHTNDPRIALEIALDHLWEDRRYYDKLELMESGQCCPCKGVGLTPSTISALATAGVLLAILVAMPIIGSMSQKKR
jgi:hypothetical protein